MLKRRRKQRRGIGQVWVKVLQFYLGSQGRPRTTGLRRRDDMQDAFTEEGGSTQ